MCRCNIAEALKRSEVVLNYRFTQLLSAWDRFEQVGGQLHLTRVYKECLELEGKDCIPTLQLRFSQQLLHPNNNHSFVLGLLDLRGRMDDLGLRGLGLGCRPGRPYP